MRRAGAASAARAVTCGGDVSDGYFTVIDENSDVDLLTSFGAP